MSNKFDVYTEPPYLQILLHDLAQANSHKRKMFLKKDKEATPVPERKQGQI